MSANDVRPFIDNTLVDKVCKRKYYQKKANGKYETWDEMAVRVASYVASCEKTPEEQKFWTEEFYRLIANKLFIPGGRVLANAGTNIKNLANCYIAQIEDSRKGIYGLLQNVAEIHAQGGGVGIDFSPLREEGALINSTGGEASGPVSFMGLFDMSADVIKQASRRGAMLAALRADHPDIFKFINAKINESRFNNFNISVLIPDSVMQAWEKDEDVTLQYHDTSGKKTIKASKIISAIAEAAWKSGEPGVIFIDTMNKFNAEPDTKLVCSNPCLHKDTYMVTAQGLEKISNCKSLIWNGDSYSGSDTRFTGVKELVTISTKSGFEYTTTPDHKFLLADNTWCDAQNLLGKKIKFEVAKKDWEGYNPYPDVNYEVLGFELGDGSYHKASGRMKYIYTTPIKDDSVADIIEEEFNDTFSVEDSGRKTICIPNNTVYADAFYGKISERLIPDWVLTLPEKKMRDFLRGLFSANGCNLVKYHKIQLVSINKKMLQQVQQMLLLFGIKAKLWIHNKKHTQEFSNGEYVCDDSYHLVISCDSYLKYLTLIGFIQDYKQEFPSEYIPKADYPYEVVVQVTPLENKDDVWDFTDNEKSLGITNGAYVHNCGEVPGRNGASCVLGSLNLKKFLVKINNVWALDYPALAIIASSAVKFLDNIVTLSRSGIELFDSVNLEDRKIGLGVMGWADVLAYMGLPYDSPEAFEAAEKTAEVLYAAAVNMSRILAEYLGPYPGYSENSVDPTTGEPREKQRNRDVLSVAPTGTISLISEVNHSIEPFYMLAYQKNFQYGSGKTEESSVVCSSTFREVIYENFEQEVADKILAVTARTGVFDTSEELSAEDNARILKIKPAFKTSYEISPEAHVLMQAAWQRHVDQSISKTINMPEESTVEDVASTIYLAYKSGLKGFTIYRNGSRSEQIMEAPENKKAPTE